MSNLEKYVSLSLLQTDFDSHFDVAPKQSSAHCAKSFRGYDNTQVHPPSEPSRCFPSGSLNMNGAAKLSYSSAFSPVRSIAGIHPFLFFLFIFSFLCFLNVVSFN